VPIIVNLSNVCQELRPLILSMLRKQIITSSSRIEERSSEGQIVLDDEQDSHKVRLLVEEFLGARDDYVVAENSEDPNEIAVLKKGDIQQLGLFICGYCPMVLKSEIERNIHQRVHYFGFG
jgi:hypothetical protein